MSCANFSDGSYLTNTLPLNNPSLTPLTPLVNPLTKNDMRRINLYEGESTLNGIGRGAKFLYDINGTAKIKLALYVITNSSVTIAGYAAIGAAAGGATGAIVGTCVKPGGGTVAGAMTGATIGATIGGAVGAVVATKKIVVDIQLSPRYQKWKIRAIAKDLFPIFDKILMSDDFINFKCPISLSLMQIPVITPCKHVFERIAIEKWLFDHSTYQNCPTCRTPLKANQLIYDEQCVLDIIAAARKQLNLLKTSPDSNTPQLVEGLEAIIDDEIDLASQVHAVKSKHEVEKAALLRLSEDEFIKIQVKEFRAKKAALGIVENH